MPRTSHPTKSRRAIQSPEQREGALAFRARRQALGMPGWRVATLAGISPNALVNYELGRQRLTVDALARLDSTLCALEAIAAQARQTHTEQAEQLAELAALAIEGRRAS